MISLKRESIMSQMCEKLENEKGLNLARERENKVKNGKKKVLNIVEELLEESKIEEDKLLIFCKFLSKNDYEDAIVERSLIKVCGYPLCDNVLGTPAKQKFKISLAEHKVYDIEKRKMFCSDRCYKASCYLQDQLEDEPFWMKSIDVMTLPDVLLYSDTKGSKGEEIKLIPSVDLEDEPVDPVIPSPESKSCQQKPPVSAPYILEGQLDELNESMNCLKIVEKNIPTQDKD